MSFIPGADYFVRYIPFPPNNGTDGGFVLPNDDGTFSIYLDERLIGQPRVKKAYQHEVLHVENNDFYNGRPISEIEDI